MDIAPNNGGYTPLIVAARDGRLKVCRFLVEKCKADINKVDKGGDTPLDWAIKRSNTEVIAYLKSKNAK